MSRKRKPQHRPKPWTPMRRGENVRPSPTELERRRAAYRDQHGLSDEEIAVMFDARFAVEVWMNDRYIAHVQRRDGGSVAELSVKRRDRKAIHDWRHLQRIKSEIAGADVEAFELYPAEDRLMDTANQYYLYCLAPGTRIPAGYEAGRNVCDVDEAADVGAAQRPLPDDWKGPRDEGQS